MKYFLHSDLYSLYLAKMLIGDCGSKLWQTVRMLLFFQCNNELLMCNSLCFLSFGITIYIYCFLHFWDLKLFVFFFSFASYCQFQVHSKSSKNIAQGTVRHHTLYIIVSFSLLSLGFFAIRSENLTTFCRIVLFIMDYFPFLENKAS